MTNTYKCQSYYDDNNILQDCTCGGCCVELHDILKEFDIDDFIETFPNDYCVNHDAAEAWLKSKLQEYGDYRERQGVVKTAEKFLWTDIHGKEIDEHDVQFLKSKFKEIDDLIKAGGKYRDLSLGILEEKLNTHRLAQKTIKDAPETASDLLNTNKGEG